MNVKFWLVDTFFLGVIPFLLFFSFGFNGWNIVSQDKFVDHQRDMESHVIGRLVLSRQSGLGAYGGLLGLGSQNDSGVNYETHPFEEQYQVYVENGPFTYYWPYKTHIGGQGFLFGLLDAVIFLDDSSVSLTMFTTLTAFLNAVIFTLIIYWFFREFGSVAGFAVFCSVFFSQWIILFGRNLYWSLWAFYAGFAALLYFTSKVDVKKNWVMRLWWLVFGASLLKLVMTGYEYITTFMVMLWVPYAYFVVKNKLRGRVLIKGLVVLGFGQLAAILFSIVILSIQIASVEGGNWQDGLTHILFSFQKRSYADVTVMPAAFTESLQADLFTVLSVYFIYPFFNPWFASLLSEPLQLLFSVSYAYIVIGLLIITLLVVRKWQDMDLVLRSLVVMSWVSILAPLSWFIIFKAHSYVHFHMNFIVWQMPFTLCAFALFGKFLALCIKKK